MNRRTILKYTAALSGTAVFTPVAMSLLSGCKPSESGGSGLGLSFFSQEQFDLVTRIADAILPKTDSPSASEVGVPATIDHMVGKVYPEGEAVAYRYGFEALASAIPEGTDIVSKLNEIEDGSPSVSEQVVDAYRHLKQQTIAYYLSSEEIGKNYLNYLPVPGAYQACISLEEAGGKAWSL